ncbi:MAG: hypothetical protein SF182_11940 [Deltaproteobacteria bacterium]|nr:hypothetical protein [Deltaproteobacteria bacterium]
MDVQADQRQRRQAADVGKALHRQAARRRLVCEAPVAGDAELGREPTEPRLAVAVDRVGVAAQRRVGSVRGEERFPQRARVADQQAESVRCCRQAMLGRNRIVVPTDGERLQQIEAQPCAPRRELVDVGRWILRRDQRTPNRGT